MLVGLQLANPQMKLGMWCFLHPKLDADRWGLPTRTMSFYFCWFSGKEKSNDPPPKKKTSPIWSPVFGIPFRLIPKTRKGHSLLSTLLFLCWVLEDLVGFSWESDHVWRASPCPKKPSCPVVPFFPFLGKGSPVKSTNPRRCLLFPGKSAGHLRKPYSSTADFSRACQPICPESIRGADRHQDFLQMLDQAWLNGQRPTKKRTHCATRSPSSAQFTFLLGEGSPTKIDYRKRVPLFDPLKSGEPRQPPHQKHTTRNQITLW